MSLNFIFSNLHIIMLAIWAVFFIIVVLRFARPLWVKNISFSVLITLAVGLHIFYGIFVTWGQYHVWATSGEYTRIFITAPLSQEAPLGIFEGLRPAFEQPLGYFSYYVFGRIWLNIIILLTLAGLLYAIIKTWTIYRGGFLPQGPEIMLVLMLISGYPGILIFVLLGFFLAFLYFGVSYIIKLFMQTRFAKLFTGYTFLSSVRSAGSITKYSRVYLEPSFIIATPIALLFGTMIFTYF